MDSANLGRGRASVQAARACFLFIRRLFFRERPGLLHSCISPSLEAIRHQEEGRSQNGPASRPSRQSQAAERQAKSGQDETVRRYGLKLQAAGSYGSAATALDRPGDGASTATTDNQTPSDEAVLNSRSDCHSSSAMRFCNA